MNSKLPLHQKYRNWVFSIVLLTETKMNRNVDFFFLSYVRFWVILLSCSGEKTTFVYCTRALVLSKLPLVHNFFTFFHQYRHFWELYRVSLLPSYENLPDCRKKILNGQVMGMFFPVFSIFVFWINDSMELTSPIVDLVCGHSIHTKRSLSIVHQFLNV